MTVEFWCRKFLLATCDDGGRIEKGDVVVVKSREYRATKVSYSVDFAGSPEQRLVCAVELGLIPTVKTHFIPAGRGEAQECQWEGTGGEIHEP